jgi:hypothetical protein
MDENYEDLYCTVSKYIKTMSRINERRFAILAHENAFLQSESKAFNELQQEIKTHDERKKAFAKLDASHKNHIRSKLPRTLVKKTQKAQNSEIDDLGYI